jgi:hypothetical protein
MLHRRVVAKVVSVEAVFVAEHDLVDALTKLLAAIVTATTSRTLVIEQRRERPRQTEAVVELAQQQHTPIGRDVGRVAAEHEWFALELKLDR